MAVLHVPALESSRMAHVTRALGEEVLASAAALGAAASPKEPPIHLSQRRVYEDTKHAWVREPVLDLYNAIEDLLSVDFADDQAVGCLLRQRAERLLAHATEVEELLRFLSRFDGVVIEIFQTAAADGLLAARLVLEHIAGRESIETFEAADDVLARIDEHRGAIPKIGLIPRDALEELGVPDLEFKDEMRLLFDLDEELVATTYTETVRRLFSTGVDPGGLAARQLGHLREFSPTEPLFQANYLDLAYWVATSPYPLLAHRAAYLTSEVIDRAATAEHELTCSLINSFYTEEATWIMESRARYLDALGRYDRGDAAAIFDAYGRVCEGVLRRYGSLLLAFEAVARGARDTRVTIESTVRAVVDRLAGAADIGRLLVQFVVPELRNADAHANVVTSASGQLVIRNHDDSIAEVSADELYGRTLGLRAALTGVDAAFNLFHLSDALPSTSCQPPAVIGSEMMHAFARRAATWTTRGDVIHAEFAAGALHVVFHGAATHEELWAMCSTISRVVTELASIEIVDPDGTPLATWSREAP